MNIGELRHKIDLCIKPKSKGPVEMLEPHYEVIAHNIWAKKTELLGKESIKSGIEHNTIHVNFIMRIRNDITESMYIKHKDVSYNILGFEQLKDDPSFILVATAKKQVIL